jgi:hypothetical protein
LRGGALPALAVGALLAIAGAFVGGRAAGGAALGAVIACVAMSAGPLVMRGTRRWSPPAVMAISLLTYGVVVVVLGVVYLALARVAWVSAGQLGVALIACSGMWTAGELWAAKGLRLLVFGDAAQGPAGAVDGASTTVDGGSYAPGQGGSGGPESPTVH